MLLYGRMFLLLPTKSWCIFLYPFRLFVLHLVFFSLSFLPCVHFQYVYFMFSYVCICVVYFIVLGLTHRYDNLQSHSVMRVSSPLTFLFLTPKTPQPTRLLKQNKKINRVSTSLVPQIDTFKKLYMWVLYTTKDVQIIWSYFSKIFLIPPSPK